MWAVLPTDEISLLKEKMCNRECCSNPQLAEPFRVPTRGLYSSHDIINAAQDTPNVGISLHFNLYADLRYR